jgi:hypothetical protein
MEGVNSTMIYCKSFCKCHNNNMIRKRKETMVECRVDNLCVQWLVLSKGDKQDKVRKMKT